MKQIIKVITIFMLVSLEYAIADTSEDTDIDLKNRIELSYIYDYLNPTKDYGHYNSALLSLYHKHSSTFTWFTQILASKRTKEGKALLFSVGAYKDWTSWLYTYSQLTRGSKSTYFPRYRIDHDFNIKFGAEQQWVAIIGGAYIDSYAVSSVTGVDIHHKDYLISPGISYYAPKFNITYRFFYNISDPGSKRSHSHLLSMGYGQDGDQWTYLDLAYGNQAYLARDFSTSSTNSYRARLNHRHWIDKRHGWFGTIETEYLKSEYHRYLTELGFFINF